MISLKKYLDSVQAARPSVKAVEPGGKDILAAAMSAYASALSEMGQCSAAACPAVGEELNQELAALSGNVSIEMSCAEVEATGAGVREQLRAWGNRTAKHYREKASQVRDLLMVMASAAESVGTRDLRCAGQLQEVTSQLREIASLDDLTQIRASIEKSAAVLKTSIDKLTSEGKTIVDELRKQVSGCRARLEQAEEIAARDALTGVRSRLNVESQIEIRIAAGSSFCVAMLDIDDFKQVNDAHGHITGDELLKQFAGELQSVCRSTDVVGRWGGDEFVILLDCTLVEAVGQRDRMHTWVCGNYTVQTSSGPVKLSLNVSIGVAEYAPGESLKELVARADDAMYEHKGISRSNACAR